MALYRIDRKDHRVHYVPIDMVMNIDLPLHQQNNENEDNIMRKGKVFFLRLSGTFWTYSPFIKAINRVGWNDPNESKSNKKLDEYITQTKEFQQDQVSEVIIDKRNLKTLLCSDTEAYIKCILTNHLKTFFLLLRFLFSCNNLINHYIRDFEKTKEMVMVTAKTYISSGTYNL